MIGVTAVAHESMHACGALATRHTPAGPKQAGNAGQAPMHPYARSFLPKGSMHARPSPGCVKQAWLPMVEAALATSRVMVTDLLRTAAASRLKLPGAAYRPGQPSCSRHAAVMQARRHAGQASSDTATCQHCNVQVNPCSVLALPVAGIDTDRQ